jgi:hypothetical protein
MVDFFKKATIIKTFDLRPETTVGKYIRTYVEDINFPISPLTVSFEEDEFTSWNGVIVNDGVMGSKGEYLYEFYQNSYPLKFFEENMTNGFSRNGVKGVQDNNYVVLDNGETFEAEFKVSKVFLLSDGIYETSGSVVAGLTGIGSSHLINNWTGSAGVG